ncbi:MAG: hypothetical protein R2719_04935 [Micropruina sp.]
MSVLIERRFRGPNTSGNGGYSAGTVATALGLPHGPAEVTLLSPPPLDRPLPTRLTDGTIRVLDGDTTVATGRAAAPSWTSPSRSASPRRPMPPSAARG